MRAWFIGLLVLPGVIGCGGELDSEECAGAKCDITRPEPTGPRDPDSLVCEQRAIDVFAPDTEAFLEGALRWSCRETAGTGAIEEQQEYCEFFAVVELPPTSAGSSAPAPQVLGKNRGEDPGDGWTESSMTLSAHQLEVLAEDSERVIGECVFTSWNSDFDLPLSCGDDCERVAGLPLSADPFRMALRVNSGSAAVELIEECFYESPNAAGDPQDDADPRHEDFLRGCLHNSKVNQTGFRKSDNIICPAAMRMSECGCGTGDAIIGYDGEILTAEDGTDIDPVDALALWMTRNFYRGFPLGTWSGFGEFDEGGALPPDCRYVNTGPEASQTLVACEIRASDALANQTDMRRFCRDRYSDNIVVHVPVPPSTTCSSDGYEAYSDTCSETPWVVDAPYSD